MWQVFVVGLGCSHLNESSFVPHLPTQEPDADPLRFSGFYLTSLPATASLHPATYLRLLHFLFPPLVFLSSVTESYKDCDAGNSEGFYE
jgi:hypothetical protein